jgi:SAM-dependent methyltransferase
MFKSLKALLRQAVVGDASYESLQQRLTSKPPREVFETIYREKMWGGRIVGGRFYSGAGSRDEEIVGPYVTAVRTHLLGLRHKQTVVDIGCGDFHVGCQLVDLAERYIACDIVRPLIEYNRRKFNLPNLEFRVVDATDEPLPVGDVALVRQVLQHLSNDQVAAVLPKLSQYSVAIVTEHVPIGRDFVPNLDMPTGVGNRLRDNSGIVLTAPPFRFSPKVSWVLCEALQRGGVIRSIAYEF